MQRKSWKAGAAFTLSLLAMSAGAADRGRPYIVQLSDAPAASYQGGVAGLAATAPAEGTRLNAKAATVKAYAGYLQKKQDAMIAAVGAKKVLHRYSVVLNGFSAVLTQAQVNKLRGMAGVLHVSPDEPREMETNYTPHFLGLDAAGGTWSMKTNGSLDQGENIIFGMVDGGIQPEQTSFYDQKDANGKWVSSGGTLAYGPAPAKYTGGCATSGGMHCNNKVIGANYFNASYKASRDFFGYTDDVTEYTDSARDSQGHGSHTSSTAGGNQGADGPLSNGAQVGPVSGIAPRGRIAAYKVCWSFLDSGSAFHNSCFTGDTSAAIEQAVVDGVDVINYSISGTLTDFLDPVEVAFFNATSAGVFVAASAGNSGPGNTVAHISPWVTTVAATTHDRLFFADASFGDGTVDSGASLSTGLPATAMILSTDAGLSGVPADSVRQCFLGSLDASKIAGKVVVCDRGTNARTDKSQEVANGGGVGMVLINAPSSLAGGGSTTLNDDAHAVPTVHLQVNYRDTVRAYAAAPGSTVAFGSRYNAPGVIAPQMASFSSRGPNLANSAILKPDVAAPGVNIWAAVAYAPPDQATHDAIAAGTLAAPPVVNLFSGTSMSSPHIAGIAALIKQRHPDWSPSAIRSAMLTTAGGVKLANGAPDPDLFGYGAGQVNPNGAADPGLIYPMRGYAYYKFLCGVGAIAPDDAGCMAFGGGIAPQDLNLPTYSSDVVGTQVFKRYVRNVGKTSATYTASGSVPGFNVVVSPASLTLAPREEGSFTVTVTTTSAPLYTWAKGSMSWTDGSHVVASPMALRPQAVGAPSELGGSTNTGSVLFPVTYGFTGTTSTLSGGASATRTAGTVGTAAASPGGATACASQLAGTTSFSFPVAAGALVARFALYDVDTSGYAGGGVDDLDLYVFNGSNQLVGSSGGATAQEMATVRMPVAGTYRACVLGYAPAGGTSNFTLSSWVINAGDGAAEFKVGGAPTTVSTGDTARVRAHWKNIASGTRFLGAIEYQQGTNSVGETLVDVEPQAALGLSTGGSLYKKSTSRH